MITLIRTNSDNPDFRALVVHLDKYLAEKDGDEHSYYAQYNKLDMLRNTVVVYKNDTPAGCGAFKEYTADTVEIKRMYVDPEYRQQGIAKLVLSELEQWAKESGYSHCVLETGKRQPEAIALYLGCGYTITPNYGQYEHMENSVCMKKDL